MALRCVRRQWPTSRGCRALELGCGTGQLSFALLDSFATCIGVDPAAGMIEVMTEKISDAGEGERMSAVCANLLEGPPPAELTPGGYDLIFSKLAFHHMPDRSGMVQACAPLLAPASTHAPQPPSAPPQHSPVQGHL